MESINWINPFIKSALVQLGIFDTKCLYFSKSLINAEKWRMSLGTKWLTKSQKTGTIKRKPVRYDTKTSLWNLSRPHSVEWGGFKIEAIAVYLFKSCRLTVKSFRLFCGCGISELLLTNLPSCVRKMEMFHRFRSVVGTVHTQPPLSQHYSPHLTACRICALKVLAHASQVPLWLTAKGKAR